MKVRIKNLLNYLSVKRLDEIRDLDDLISKLQKFKDLNDPEDSITLNARILSQMKRDYLTNTYSKYDLRVRLGLKKKK